MPQWVLRVNARFEAAHHLTSYKGAPEPVHGHSWRVEATLTASELGAEGMAWDFVEVQKALLELTSRLDHGDINTVPPFDRSSPTTERIAVWFFDGLAARLPGAPLTEVTVWEGPDCSATYRPSP